MSRKIIRVGIVGLRFGAKVHGPAFGRVEDCRVVAVAGREHGDIAVAESLVPGTTGFAGWRQMLDGVDLDAIAIAVPPVAQAAIATEAATRGIAVFCEKPAAVDVSGAEAMLHAVTTNRVTHAINFLFPEIPAWIAAKQAVDEMASVHPLRHAALTWRIETYAHRHSLKDSWKRSAHNGGGALNGFVAHSVYYLEWLFGPIGRVLAKLSPADEIDDSRVDAWIEFRSGMSASLSVAIDCPFGTGHRLEVYGHDGVVILDNPSADYASGFQLTRRSRSQSPDSAPLDMNVAVSVDGRIQATSKIAGRFVLHLRSGGLPTPNLSHGLRVQRLMDVFRNSHRSQSWMDAPHAGV
jgi:predicted dehydrogenase